MNELEKHEETPDSEYKPKPLSLRGLVGLLWLGSKAIALRFVAPRLIIQDDGYGMKRNEAHERCDGCRQPHPASELTLIGDGSIKGSPPKSAFALTRTYPVALS